LGSVPLNPFKEKKLQPKVGKERMAGFFIKRELAREGGSEKLAFLISMRARGKRGKREPFVFLKEGEETHGSANAAISGLFFLGGRGKEKTVKSTLKEAKKEEPEMGSGRLRNQS